MSDLTEKSCQPCEEGTPALSPEKVKDLLKQIPDWQLDKTAIQQIFRIFQFKNYYQTLAFVNAVAWMAHQENHHPDLAVSYKTCTVKYSTHAIQGLSDNDFICAAKVDRLIKNA